jgi:hypothetical protein
MNLQENIYRVKQMMGVINEDNRSNVIMKMIDEIGLYNTIKIVGSYDDILNHIDHEQITDEEKIKFINEVVKVKSSEFGMNGLSIYEIGMSPIIFDKDGDRFKEIIYFAVNGVSIDVYNGSVFTNNQKALYTMLPTDVLDDIFIWMLDFLERK